MPQYLTQDRWSLNFSMVFIIWITSPVNDNNLYPMSVSTPTNLELSFVTQLFECFWSVETSHQHTNNNIGVYTWVTAYAIHRKLQTGRDEITCPRVLIRSENIACLLFLASFTVCLLSQRMRQKTEGLVLETTRNNLSYHYFSEILRDVTFLMVAVL